MRVGGAAAAVVALALGATPGRIVAQTDARSALVSVSVLPETVTVGQRFTVRVRVRAPKVATVAFPDTPAPSESIDPVDPRTVTDGAPGDLLDRTATYTFAAWNTGTRTLALGPVTVSVGGRGQEYGLAAATVVVRSLLPADTSQLVPRGAQQPMALAGRLWQYLVLGALLAGVLVWWWFRRRARRRAAAVPTVGEAWEEAHEAHAALQAMLLASAGEPGRHVIAHVDVMRAYLARRFPAAGAGLSARDVVVRLGSTDFPLPMERVAVLLERDAALRFAHATVDATEAEALAQEAWTITEQVQLAHEARLRAMERPPRPRRR